MSNKEKYSILGEWLPDILETIKKDLRSEHLSRDAKFCKQYLSGKNPQKATISELAEAYRNAINEGSDAESLGEFISNRWLLKHTDVYEFFSEKLSEINPDFTELEEIEAGRAEKIAQEAAAAYGSKLTYLFSVINSVVFPASVFENLRQAAKVEVEKEQAEMAEADAKDSLEKMKHHHEIQIARLTDKYEKKLTGMQKKYVIDTQNLKKQLASLQRKLGVL